MVCLKAFSGSSLIRQGSDYCKTFPISLWGSSFKSMTIKHGIPTNESFGGIYNLNFPETFEEKLTCFLKLAENNNGLIMTHPGLPDAILAERGSFTYGGKIEFDLLTHSRFREVLQRFNSSPSKVDFGVSSA